MSTAPRHNLPPLHLALALAVMAVWGTNFVVIKLALAHLPPLTLAALRFTFAFLPLALFIKRPAVSWTNLATYGVLIGAGQFGLLFTAMRSDITPGLASLVVQVQVFFTIGLSMRLTGEKVAHYQIAALLLAVAGLAVIALHTDGSATPLGLILVVGAALCWALGNMTSRAAGPVNMLAYVVWSSLFAVPPLLGLSLLTEGWPRISTGIAAADGKTWAAVLWQSVGNTMFGYGAWGWLLSRHPAASVAPLALLVPVFGLGASALLMGEAMPVWKLAAFALVMAGLALGILWPQLAGRKKS
ncbi:EamA family transporter [Novosphingobium sp.]|uniref:EamA family transporter n=1 Tax=Novosphingobium sp. TaxID=1874826 RepID=UPI0035B02C7E